MLIPTAFEAAALFPEPVMAALRRHGLARADYAGHIVDVALTGFGLAAAGAGAAWAIGRYLAHRPKPVLHGLARDDLDEGRRTKDGGDASGVPSLGSGHALRPVSARGHAFLVGIAGTYDPGRVPVGEALVATSAQCLGIGAGTGRHHRSAGAMGWPQGLSLPDRPPVSDEIALYVPPATFAVPPGSQGALLSVAAASLTRREAAARAAAHPGAVAEEMEAFAVALAARLWGVPLSVVRGIANVAGDRAHARWRAEAAMQSASALLQRLIAWYTCDPRP